MFRYVFVVVTLVATTCSAQIVPPKVDPDVKAVVAKLAGPAKANIGEQLKYTTDGSVGQDILFSISPPTTGFEPVKLFDGKDTPGVIFTPGKKGIYYIYMMLNNNGKTAYALQVVDVQSTPNTPDVIDKTYFPLKAAIKADRAESLQADQYITKLEELFGQCEVMANASSSWVQFNKTFHDAALAALDDKLPATRLAIKEYLEKRFGKDASAPYDKNLIRAVQSEILQTIKASK